MLRAALALTLLLAGPLAAQDLAARRDAAERYVNSPAQQGMIDDMLAPENLRAQLSAMAPGATGEQLDGLAEIMGEELAGVRPAVEAAMVEAAAAHFTVAELEALDAFYRTPEGAAVVTKMQPFFADAMRRIAPEMAQANAKFMARAQARFGR